jgi:hypothetical protein
LVARDFCLTFTINLPFYMCSLSLPLFRHLEFFWLSYFRLQLGWYIIQLTLSKLVNLDNCKEYFVFWAKHFQTIQITSRYIHGLYTLSVFYLTWL